MVTDPIILTVIIRLAGLIGAVDKHHLTVKQTIHITTNLTLLGDLVVMVPNTLTGVLEDVKVLS